VHNTEDKKIKPTAENISLSGTLFSGTIWSISIRWASKFLGIISLGICARILSPEDYGLVTMAMVIVGFFSLIFELGLETALIRNPNPNPALYNSAWSIRIIQRASLALIVIISAPLIAYFYNDHRVTLILVAVGFAEFVCAFENIYSVNLRKNLNFRSDFIYMLIPRIASFCAAVTAVILLKSYWGLVIGICATEVTRTLLSYFIVKERPKWSLNQWRELAGFSGWYMARGLADFIVSESDRLILGILAGAKTTGIFSVAKEVSTLPSTEIVLPICRALTPTLSTIHGEPQRLSNAISKALSATMLIAAPVSIGFALISNEFVLIIFGPKWKESISVLSILCFGGIAFAFREITANAMIVTGKIRITFILSWINALVLLALFYPIYLFYSLIGIAWLIVICAFLIATAYAILLFRSTSISGRLFVQETLRPIVSAALMYFCIHATFDTINQFDPVLILIMKVTTGSIIYATFLTLLWTASGKPKNSSEAILFTEAFNRTKKAAHLILRQPK